MLRPSAILETVLYVDDLDAALNFYRDVLQLKPVHADERMRVLRVSDDNHLLLFLRGGTPGPVDTPGGMIPAHDGKGAMHVAFTIDRADVAAWRRRVESLGTPIESTVAWRSDETSLYFRDPAGNLVELATPGLWDRRT
jgi:catechol 2,3-dioxygenase-like lactoylglutathione lyase family enzyme